MDQKNIDIQKVLESLPKAVKDYIYSTELTATVTTLGKKYGLHIDVIGSIETQINLTLAGLTPLEEFSENIGYAVKDADKTQKILADIEAEIFAPLKAKEKEQIKMNPVQQIQKSVAIPAPAPYSAEATKDKPPQATPIHNDVPMIVEAKMTTTVAPAPTHEDVPMIMPVEVTPSVAKAMEDKQGTETAKKPIDTTGIPKHKYPGSIDPYREPAE